MPTEQWMREAAKGIMEALFDYESTVTEWMPKRVTEIIASEYEKAHAPATPAPIVCVCHDMPYLDCPDNECGIRLRVAEAAPTGKWSQYMGKVLPCGHTNAQHEYFLDGEVKLIACPVVKSEAAPTADLPNEYMIEYWLKDYAQFRPNWWPLIKEYLGSLPSPPAGQGRGE